MKEINENILNFVSDIRKIEIWKYIYKEKLKLFYLKKLIQKEMIIEETSITQKGCTEKKNVYIKKKNDDNETVINNTNVDINKSLFLNSPLYYDSYVNLRKDDEIYNTTIKDKKNVEYINEYSLVKNNENIYNNSKKISKDTGELNDKIIIDNNSKNCIKKIIINDSVKENKNTNLIGDSNDFYIFNNNFKNIYSDGGDNIHSKMNAVKNKIDEVNIYNDNNIDSNNNKINNDNYKINIDSNKNDNSIMIQNSNDEKSGFYNNINYECIKCNKKDNLHLFKKIYSYNKKDFKANENNLKKKVKNMKNLNQTNFNFNNVYECYYDDENEKNKNMHDYAFFNKHSNDIKARKLLIKTDNNNCDYKKYNNDKNERHKDHYKNEKCLYYIKKENKETKNSNDETQTKINNKIHLNTNNDNYYVNPCTSNLKNRNSKNIEMDKKITSSFNISNNYNNKLISNNYNYIKNIFIRMSLEQKKKYYVEYNRKINNIIKDEVIKGIPDHIRGFAWQILVKSYMYKENNGGKRYQHYLSINNKYESAIKKDINRTYPKHILFKNNYEKGQTILFNVLKAYSNYNSDLGYCQGMAFIVATFILYMSEEDAFFMLISLLDKYKLNDLFSSDMPLLNEYLYILDQLLLFFFPKIHNHLQKENIHSSMYASQWFITLFSYNINILYSIRIWDFFFIHNYTFLFKVALAFFKLQEDIILTESFEDILNRLKILSKHVELDLLIKTALDINISNDLINKISSNYKFQK
ncbi:GTPase-activating protein, putative [Plasmodium relictum]|uniref:GTPase-activating protein, putative n=1 Tax=Plasmodium relictum TaxID=85471 RepID=A0A1J1H845_PLARL|nr:GTPase-activating protein, putative [Plasmodium relictum]CRH01136.1 GTPase-activating protein, putative [Plasmodium relictum]